jgi:hypothetical protein
MATQRSTTSGRKPSTAKKAVPEQRSTTATTGSTRTRTRAQKERLLVVEAEVAPEIKTEFIDISPELAAELVKPERNYCNRSVKESVVKAYARDMAAGRWRVNGEGIQIDVDGGLLNGQHRMLAIIMSGKTIKMLVVSGLPRNTRATMDAGRKRTNTDNFTMDGVKNAKAVAAISRRAVLWERGDRRFRDIVTFVEAEEMLAKHPEIHRSAEIAERVHRSFKLIPTSALGTGHFLMHQTAPDETPWFFGAIEKGTDLSEGSPVLTLRERVRRDRDDGIRVGDVRALAYLVRAWNAHRRGKTLARIQHALNEPIPDVL